MPENNTSTNSAVLSYSLVALLISELTLSAYNIHNMETALEELDGKTQEMSVFNVLLSFITSMLIFLEIVFRAPFEIQKYEAENKQIEEDLKNDEISAARLNISSREFDFTLEPLSPTWVTTWWYRGVGLFLSGLSFSLMTAFEFVEVDPFVELFFTYLFTFSFVGMSFASVFQAGKTKSELKENKAKISALCEKLKAAETNKLKETVSSVDVSTGQSNLSAKELENNKKLASDYNKLAELVGKALSKEAGSSTDPSLPGYVRAVIHRVSSLFREVLSSVSSSDDGDSLDLPTTYSDVSRTSSSVFFRPTKIVVKPAENAENSDTDSIQSDSAYGDSNPSSPDLDQAKQMKRPRDIPPVTNAWTPSG